MPRLVNFMRDAVTESFRVSFVESVVPATERTLQAMFSQVGAKFDDGVASILEQVRVSVGSGHAEGVRAFALGADRAAIVSSESHAGTTRRCLPNCRRRGRSPKT